MDAIRQITEKAIEYYKPAFMCFVDLEKAFDIILLTDVIRIVYNKQITLDITKTIENIYKRNKTEIIVNGEVTEPIEIIIVIRQGDSLSPLLFNLILDEIKKKS